MKKSLSALLALLMTLTLFVPTYAAEVNPSQDDLSNYTVHTIDLTSDDRTAVQSSEHSSAIDRARQFVDSLNLSDEYDYLEQVAYAELDDYEARGVDLTSFSVYVPTATSSEAVYGTFSGRTFYYTTAVGASVRVDEQRDIVKSSSNEAAWERFASGITQMIVSYASLSASIQFSLFDLAIRTAGDSNYTVKNGSYLMYTYNVSTVTRAIYSYKNNGSKFVVRTDQRGTGDFFINFAPVGTGFSHAFYEIKHLSNQAVTTPGYYNSSAILSQCYAYFKRKASVSFRLSDYVMHHNFE